MALDREFRELLEDPRRLLAPLLLVARVDPPVLWEVHRELTELVVEVLSLRVQDKTEAHLAEQDIKLEVQELVVERKQLLDLVRNMAEVVVEAVQEQ